MPSLLIHVVVEAQRLAEAGTTEVAVVVVVAQQAVVLLQRERQLLLEFVERHQDGEAVGADLALDRRHHLLHLGPGLGHFAVAGLA